MTSGSMTTVNSLIRLWDQDLSRPIAVRDGVLLTLADLRLRVEAWYRPLSTSASAENRRWGLFNPDPFEFTAQMLALWHSGHIACLPGDNLAGTRQQLHPMVAGVLGEWPDALVCMPDTAGNDTLTLPPLDPRALVVEVFTSGSTGEPQAIPKYLHQLEAELASLEQLWPVSGDAVVLSTVSHQHIYGLLFRILRPLANGSVFDCRLSHFMEDLLIHAAQYCNAILVSSPTHLRRLPDAEQGALLNGRWQSVFSSAGPLLKQDSLRAQSVLGAPVHEIYGSSETGGIAWRVQSAGADSGWTPLPGVAVRGGRDTAPEVKSPHLPSMDWTPLADRIEWQDETQFQLLGRSDTIVKVEGKRVSLSAMEKHLAACPEVTDVRLLKLATDQRDALAAVIELSPDAMADLKTSGKRPLVDAFKQALAPHFEAVVLPRRWRLVERLPYNAQGKVPLSALQALFAKRAPVLPEVLNADINGDEVSLTLNIPADLLYFQGHFDGHPILPGVVQVHWAEHFARQYLTIDAGAIDSFSGLEVIKFQQVIQPDTTVTLALQWLPDKHKIVFRYFTDQSNYSSGRLCFDGA